MLLANRWSTRYRAAPRLLSKAESSICLPLMSALQFPQDTKQHVILYKVIVAGTLLWERCILLREVFIGIIEKLHFHPETSWKRFSSLAHTWNPTAGRKLRVFTIGDCRPDSKRVLLRRTFILIMISNINHLLVQGKNNRLIGTIGEWLQVCFQQFNVNNQNWQLEMRGFVGHYVGPTETC